MDLIQAIARQKQKIEDQKKKEADYMTSTGSRVIADLDATLNQLKTHSQDYYVDIKKGLYGGAEYMVRNRRTSHMITFTVKIVDFSVKIDVWQGDSFKVTTLEEWAALQPKLEDLIAERVA